MKCAKLILLVIMIPLAAAAVLAGCAPDNDEEMEALQGTVAALGTQLAQRELLDATRDAFISYLATRPPLVITPVDPDAAPTPYRPVEGSVQIENGRCCVGGPAGQPLQITLDLEAFSPQSEVSEMRLAVGSRFLAEEEMADLPWEPFARQKVVEIAVPLNWSGAYASVQFRDAGGDLSRVLHDDIAVEGE